MMLILWNIPDWFVMQDELKIWHDDNDYCNNNEIVEWYDDKAKKAEIKEDLMSIAWHPKRMQDWCMVGDEKERIKEIFT